MQVDPRVGGDEGEYVLTRPRRLDDQRRHPRGDLVVVRPQDTATDGDIVVALLGEDATVKRFFRESDHVRLQPENDTMEPIRSREVQVLGRVVGVLRKVACMTALLTRSPAPSPARASACAAAPAARRPGPTLDDVVSRAWEVLRADLPAALPGLRRRAAAARVGRRRHGRRPLRVLRHHAVLSAAVRAPPCSLPRQMSADDDRAQLAQLQRDWMQASRTATWSGSRRSSRPASASRRST